MVFQLFIWKSGMCQSQKNHECLSYGAPKGSILGSILFLIYGSKDGLCNGGFDGWPFAYVDDAAFIYNDKNLNIFIN